LPFVSDKNGAAKEHVDDCEARQRDVFISRREPLPLTPLLPRAWPCRQPLAVTARS
jgi:hypothetical protein